MFPFRGWVEELIHEIEQCIPYPLEPRLKNLISYITVIDRFSNPFIDHYWKDICMNYTLKLKLRVIPLLWNTKGFIAGFLIIS